MYFVGGKKIYKEEKVKRVLETLIPAKNLGNCSIESGFFSMNKRTIKNKDMLYPVLLPVFIIDEKGESRTIGYLEESDYRKIFYYEVV